jgi:hypothetical protein
MFANHLLKSQAVARRQMPEFQKLVWRKKVHKFHDLAETGFCSNSLSRRHNFYQDMFGDEEIDH